MNKKKNVFFIESSYKFQVSLYSESFNQKWILSFFINNYMYVMYQL